jgi:hypothetical protein
MTHGGHHPHAEILQALGGQVRQDCVVDLVLAECRLVSFEAEAPQATPETPSWRLIGHAPCDR